MALESSERTQVMSGTLSEQRDLTRLQRLVALDLMRGLVMVLMAIDHSSDAFNGGRVFGDSTAFYHPGSPLPTAQFLTRWITHLCAPTFLFLAGAGLAFSVKKQLAQGKTERQVNAFMLTRGILIAAFELWISYFVMPKGKYLFQVLYGIGSSYVLMVPLRRLGAKTALIASVVLMLGLELAVNSLGGVMEPHAPLLATLLLLGGSPGPLIVAYPTLHWLSLMLLGWAFGNHLIARPPSPVELSRKLVTVGLLLFVGFVLIRGLNGYGNMGLLRESLSLVQWLHVSKYPPSLSYYTLELSLCCFGLAAFTSLFSGKRAPSRNNVLLVLGQTPMFFYLLHFPLLIESAERLHLEKKLGLGGAYLGAAIVVALLYPACRAYRTYKAAHKHGWTRYV